MQIFEVRDASNPTKIQVVTEMHSSILLGALYDDGQRISLRSQLPHLTKFKTS